MKEEQVVALHRAYIEKEMSFRQLEEKTGISRDKIRYHFHKRGLPVRDRNEAVSLAFKQGRAGTASVGKRGSEAANWRGGRRVQSSGYIDIWMPEHPRARASGYVLEHLVVWMEHYGEVPEGWHVHHINGDKSDNRIENLEAMPSKKHVNFLRLQGEKMKSMEETIAKQQARIKALEDKIARFKC